MMRALLRTPRDTAVRRRETLPALRCDSCVLSAARHHPRQIVADGLRDALPMLATVCGTDDRSAAAHDPAHSRRRRRSRNQVSAHAALLHPQPRIARVASLYEPTLTHDPRD